jgi:hypothetical protein
MGFAFLFLTQRLTFHQKRDPSPNTLLMEMGSYFQFQPVVSLAMFPLRTML